MKRLTQCLLSAGSILVSIMAVQLLGCNSRTESPAPDAPKTDEKRDEPIDATHPATPNADNPQDSAQHVIDELKNDQEEGKKIYGPPEMLEPPTDNKPNDIKEDTNPIIDEYKNNNDDEPVLIYGPPEMLNQPPQNK